VNYVAKQRRLGTTNWTPIDSSSSPISFHYSSTGDDFIRVNSSIRSDLGTYEVQVYAETNGENPNVNIVDTTRVTIVPAVINNPLTNPTVPSAFEVQVLEG